jgi:hypothetical protein
MSQRAIDAWAGRLNAQAADYFSRPTAPLDDGGLGGGYGGYGGGGGGGGWNDYGGWDRDPNGYQRGPTGGEMPATDYPTYEDMLKEYYNRMVFWAINRPTRGG